MDCQGVRKYMELWLDDEMDASSRRDFSNHLGVCNPCREWVEGETRLEKAIRDRVPSSPMPAERWTRIVRRLEREELPTRRGAIAAIAVTVAACAVLACIWWAMWRRHTPDLATAAIELQRKCARGDLKMELRTHSADRVEDFLEKRLGMQVDMQHAMSGQCGPHEVRFEGASVVTCGGVDCACLAYTCCGAPVTVILLKSRDLERFPEMAEAIKKLGPRLRDRSGATNIEVRVTQRQTPSGLQQPWIACLVGDHPIEDLASVFEKI